MKRKGSLVVVVVVVVVAIVMYEYIPSTIIWLRNTTSSLAGR